MSGRASGRYTAGERPIGDVAKHILRRKRFYQKGKDGPLRQTWVDLVGDSVATQTRICSFAGGELVVEVYSPALLHELNNFMKQALLDGFRATDAGRDVTLLRFRLQNATSRTGGRDT